MMDIGGLEPGSYKLLAWAGDGHNGSPALHHGDRHRGQTPPRVSTAPGKDW